jgi:hypothetical protein
VKHFAQLALVAALCSLGAGCVSRDFTRYNSDGKLWSRDRIRFFLVRGEATKVREKVTESREGDYERDVSIGAVRGETETDKLAQVAGAVAEGAARGAKP